MSELTKAVDRVRTARWKAWTRMASQMPDHRILSIELLRSQEDETLAVFTIVKDHLPVQYVLQGDALGRNLKALVSPHHPGSEPGSEPGGEPEGEPGGEIGDPPGVEGLRMAAMDPPPPLPADTGASAEVIALGEPPPKQPPTPGVVALGASLLPTVFNLGEWALADPAANR